MTVNLNQHRWTVGVFNNRNLPLKKTHGSSLQEKIFKTYLLEIGIFVIVLSVRHAISLSSAQNIRFLCRSFVHYVWLYSLAIRPNGNIEENLGSKASSSDCLSIFH